MNIVNKYYNATSFGYIYELKPEYTKENCVKDPKTGIWSYVD